MLKVMFAVLAVALASTASAAGWRDLRIDASSDTTFKESVAALQGELTPSRRLAFALSLQDIWREGTQRAMAEQREYTSTDYLRQLDGLGYEDVVKLTDPSGRKEARYRKDYRDLREPVPNEAAFQRIQRALQNGERIPTP